MSNSTLDILEDFLVKARKRLSDENPDYSDQDEAPDYEGLDDDGEGDSQGEEDPADAYLRENDPSYRPEKPADDEVSMDEDVDYERQQSKSASKPAAPTVRRRSASAAEPAQAPADIGLSLTCPSFVC